MAVVHTKPRNNILTGRYIRFFNFQLVHPNTTVSHKLMEPSLIPHSYLRRGTFSQDLLGCTWRRDNPIEQPGPQTWCGNQQSLPCLGNHMKRFISH